MWHFCSSQGSLCLTIFLNSLIFLVCMWYINKPDKMQTAINLMLNEPKNIGPTRILGKWFDRGIIKLELYFWNLAIMGINPLCLVSSTPCHVNTTKLYLHFSRFAGDAHLCSNLFVLYRCRCIISFIKIELLWFQTWTKSWIRCFTCIFQSTENSICQKCKLTTLLHSLDDLFCHTICTAKILGAYMLISTKQIGSFTLCIDNKKYLQN